jgi:hypothetical protein
MLSKKCFKNYNSSQLLFKFELSGFFLYISQIVFLADNFKNSTTIKKTKDNFGNKGTIWEI